MWSVLMGFFFFFYLILGVSIYYSFYWDLFKLNSEPGNKFFLAF